MKRLPIVIVLLSLMLLITESGSSLAAAGASTIAPNPLAACKKEINTRLAHEERLYRTVLFGRSKAKDEPIDAVRFDTEGNAWTKLKEDEWRSVSQGFKGTTWGDDQMDKQSEKDEQQRIDDDGGISVLTAPDKWEKIGVPTEPAAPENKTKDENPPLRGIFSAQGVPTSDLLPALTQSYRALQCRVAAVCAAASKSVNLRVSDKNDPFIVSIDGCKPFVMQPLASCGIKEQSNTPTESVSMPLDQFIAFTECGPTAKQLLDHERAALKLAVSYDASYRSLLQFAGSFDDFLKTYRTTLLSPLTDGLSLVSQFSRLPCFLSECSTL